ncbi:MAG: low molecular weight phosphotyrosine protein phosphatase [Rhodocyclaceae bacterium]|nr:low molecular weight phosphotyrosine protein phosphatase [Rhodocyclaceae bacterium]MBX3669815.1 low molecular weight phosphotyrosine protein phosphatase [Rhodocyclaceae bacterium]
MGNICRSPLAEGAARMYVERNGLADLVEVDSAGTGNWHEGEAPDPRAQKIARERGVDISRQRARQIRPVDFERFDYILAMDEQNLEALERACPEALVGRVGLLMEHTRVFEEREVPDPYYGGEAGFARVWNMVDDAVAGFFAKLDLSAPPDDTNQAGPG